MRSAKLTALLAAGLLAACSSSKERVPADAPGYVKGKAVHPTVKIGRPYKINGDRYYPEYEPDYDEVGMASWKIDSQW
jgi:rare lipoprotein A (peptidoglycan hydrolase)